MPPTVEELTAEEASELRAEFSEHDKDGDGRITLEELRQTLGALGEELTDAELMGVILKADTDGNGTIDFAEFLAFVSRRMRQTGPGDEIREAFDAFDRNHDGLVAIDELLQVMERLGEKMTRAEAEASLRRGDSDGDGQLTYEEFVAFMMSPR